MFGSYWLMGLFFSLDFGKKPEKLFMVDLNIWFKF